MTFSSFDCSWLQKKLIKKCSTGKFHLPIVCLSIVDSAERDALRVANLSSHGDSNFFALSKAQVCPQLLGHADFVFAVHLLAKNGSADDFAAGPLNLPK